MDGHMAAGTMTKAAPSSIIGKAGGIIVKPIPRNAGIINPDPTSIIDALRPNLSTNLPKNGARVMEAKIMMVVVPPAVVNMWMIL
jgi:hypothetical protein